MGTSNKGAAIGRGNKINDLSIFKNYSPRFKYRVAPNLTKEKR